MKRQKKRQALNRLFEPLSEGKKPRPPKQKYIRLVPRYPEKEAPRTELEL